MAYSPPTFSMDGATYPILCGFCENPIALRSGRHGGAGDFGCAGCDNWAHREEIQKIVGSYTGSAGKIESNRFVQHAGRQSKIMTFKGDLVSQNNYRFKVHLDS